MARKMPYRMGSVDIVSFLENCPTSKGNAMTSPNSPNYKHKPAVEPLEDRLVLSTLGILPLADQLLPALQGISASLATESSGTSVQLQAASQSLQVDLPPVLAGVNSLQAVVEVQPAPSNNS